jgi:putative redox protein
MPGVNLKWTGGQQFLAADEAGQVVVTDQQGQGIKPSDLLLVSLAGCAGIDVVNILQKKRQRFSAIEAQVTKQNAADPPWTIEKIEIQWVVRGRDLRQKAAEDAVHLALEKYCSVAASLNSELVSRVRVVNEDQDTSLDSETDEP